MRQNSLIQTIIIASVLIFGIFSVGVQMGISWTGENNTISPGYIEGFTGGNFSQLFVGGNDLTDLLAYPEQPASYIVFNSGANYYAKNGSTGQIEFSGSNSSLVIQQAIDSLDQTDKGWIEVKGGLGTYSISGKIIIDGFYNFQLIGEGWPRLQSVSGFSGYTIEVKNIPSYGCVRISGFFIDGVDKSRGGGINIVSSTWVDVSYNHIENVQNHCIEIVNSGELHIYENHLIGAGTSKHNIYYNGGADSKIYNNEIGYGVKGILCEGTGCDRHIIAENHIWETTDGISISGNYHLVTSNIIEKIPGVGIISNGNRNRIIANQIADEGGVTPTTGIQLYNSWGDRNLVALNQIWGCDTYGIRSESGATANLIISNYIENCGTTISIVESNNQVKHNYGFLTENSGTQSVTGAVNSVAVTHGLAGTPDYVLVTPLQSGCGEVWVTAKGASTFTVNFTNQPGGSTWYFDWTAVYVP